jgi:hypothetical protein
MKKSKLIKLLNECSDDIDVEIKIWAKYGDELGEIVEVIPMNDDKEDFLVISSVH